MTMPDLLNTRTLSGTRIREGIRDYMVKCEDAGRSKASTLYLYVNGMSPDGKVIDAKEHLLRGASLDQLVKTWLSMWGQEETD